MKTTQVRLALLALLLMWSACRQADQSIPPGKELDYGVYSAIIDQNCPVQANRQPVLIISNKMTKPYVHDWNALLQQPNLSQITNNPDWQRFVTSTDSSQFSILPLSGAIPSNCNRTQILTDTQWAYYFDPSSKQGLDGLRRDFPGFSSFVTFSSVIYSSDQTRALCYSTSVCGGLCGSGDLYFLERKVTGWTVTATILMWIS